MSTLEEVLALQFVNGYEDDDNFILHYIELHSSGNHRVQKWWANRDRGDELIAEKESDPTFVKWLSQDELRKVMGAFCQLMDAHGVYGRKSNEEGKP